MRAELTDRVSRRLGITAPESQSSIVFTSVFVIVWCGAAVVTLNSQLLGGRMWDEAAGTLAKPSDTRSSSFFQSICVLGYCIFPLVLASLLSLFLPSIVLRGVIVGVAFVWAAYGGLKHRPPIAPSIQTLLFLQHQSDSSAMSASRSDEHSLSIR